MSYSNNRSLAISEGILSTFTNVLLFSIFWVGASVGKHGSNGACRAFEEAFEQVDKVNYAAIKRAFYRLKKRGMLGIHKKGYGTQIYITDKGQNKISSLFPDRLQKKRWSGDIFMITYDIPEGQRNHRDSLRAYLKNCGCAMLQKSVWLTPYDPSYSLTKYIKEKRIVGSVIVSQVSRNAYVGKKQAIKLVQELYKVNSINNRYKSIIRNVRKNNSITAIEYLHYLSIRHKDPNLPLELLPPDWTGEVAYNMFVEELKRRL